MISLLRKFPFKHPSVRALLALIFWLALDLSLRHMYISKDSTYFVGWPEWINYLGSFALAYALICVVQLSSLKFPKLSLILTGLFALTWTAMALTNTLLFEFFGEYLFPSAIEFIASNKSYLYDYLITYSNLITITLFVFLVTFWVFIFKPYSSIQTSSKALSLRFVLALALAIGGIKATEKQTRAKLNIDITSIQSISKHILRVSENTLPLKPALRHSVIHKAFQYPRPKTILVIVNESMGIHHTWLSDSNLTKNLTQTFNQDSNWILYTQGFTNATATNVSMPSIFSGVSPAESYQKLHQVPMFWDLAKKAGYETVYITSQRLKWATLWDFLINEPIDHKWSYENINLSIVNDMGADDQSTLEHILPLLATNKPLFIFINTNAMHAPFQHQSTHFQTSAAANTDFKKSIEILDQTLSSLIQELKKTNRYDEALIFNSADHGETPTPLHPQPRIANYYDEIIQIPIAVKIPSTWAKFRPQIQAQKNKAITNIDLVPTLADALNLSYHEYKQNPWIGYSLLQNLPTQRIMSTISTNALRHWDKDGFALIQGPYRMTCHQVIGCQYFNITQDPKQSHPLPFHKDSLWMQNFLKAIQQNSELKRVYQSL